MSLQLSAPQPLVATHLLDEFASGEASLDEWLKRRALSNQLSGASRTFVVTDQEERVFGYYAMAAPVAELTVKQVVSIAGDKSSANKKMKQLLNVKLFILLTIFVLVLFPTKATGAFDKNKLNVLVLLSYQTSLPWTESFIKGLKEARESYNNRVDYYIETMDSIRLESMDEKKWTSYLEDKYQSIYFDAVMAESDFASRFVSNNKIIFPEKASFVYYTNNVIEFSTNSITLVNQTEKSVQKTFEMALLHNPRAKHIFIIDNQLKDFQFIIDKLIALTNETPLNLRITILNNFSLDTLRKQLMSLPSDSIVFYTLVFKDNTGEKFIPKDFLSEISSVSTAPIYSFWSPLMGSGIVGGKMINGEETAIQMVNAVIDYLENGKYKNEYNTLKNFIDWKALVKYHIDPDLIPQNAIVTNKPVSIFQTYYLETIIAMLTFFSVTISYGFYRLVILNNKSEQLARMDPLTNLHNRRAFFEKGYEAYNLAKRLGKPLSVLMIDIDLFKNINDTFGHSTGDEVIKALGDIIKRTTRKIDISARIGGEEFSVIVVFSDVNDSAKLAYRILQEVNDALVDTGKNKPQIHFAVSIGVFGGMFALEGYSLEDALKYADEALYQAKQTGRNRVVIYGENSPMAISTDS